MTPLANQSDLPLILLPILTIYSLGQGLMISSKAPIKLSRIFFDVYFLFLLILFIIITKGPLFTTQILASVLHSFLLAGGRGAHLPSY